MTTNATWERRYILLSEAYYAEDKLTDNCVDEVYFGLFASDGSTADCEVAIAWYDLVDGEVPTARLECFENGWRAFHVLRDVLEALSHSPSPLTPTQACHVLEQCGFVDGTPRPTLSAVMAGVQQLEEV